MMDITCRLHAETEKAILISDDGIKDNAVWLPKSQVEFQIESSKNYNLGIITVTLPEWMAKDKGLI